MKSRIVFIVVLITYTIGANATFSLVNKDTIVCVKSMPMNLTDTEENARLKISAENDRLTQELNWIAKMTRYASYNSCFREAQ